MVAENQEVGLPSFIRRFPPPFLATPLGPLLTLSLRKLAGRRPQLFERLGEHSKTRYLIDPTDLSFAFCVIPDGPSSFVRVTGKSGEVPCDVVVRGPILTLLGILDGSLDGDALFFHRAVSINGRTEAIIALRNAIEDAELRPSDLLGLHSTPGRLADAGIQAGLDMIRKLVTGAAAREGARS